MKIFLLVICSLIVGAFGAINQQCGICNALSKFTCINQNTFASCESPFVTTSCEPGKVCKFGGFVDPPNDALLCVNPAENPASTALEFDCQNRCLGVCSGKLYACTGNNTYKVCGAGITDMEHTCSTGQICTINAACEAAGADTAPLCPSNAITNPTNPTADSLCQGTGIINGGKYDLTPRDEYCQRYVYCTYINGVWRGRIYICPGTQQFNQASQRCERPPVNGCRNFITNVV